MPTRLKGVGIAAALFLISGFAALVYQVIWQRILGIFSGVHIYSITMIVTAFMAGLGIGSLIGGKYADRLSHRAGILAFAVCEACIGLFALASPWIYYDLAYLKLGFLVRYTFALPLVQFLLLLIPTFLMGASLPLLSRGLVQVKEHAARTIGILYGMNTIGAALGAWTAIWLLIGRFGFVGTIRLASLLNFAAALGALWLWRRVEELDPGREDPEPSVAAAVDVEHPSDVRAFGLYTWALIYSISGFIALSLEILWFRILDVSIKSSPYVFGHLLGVFLIFLGLGGVVGAFTVSRAKRPDLIFLWGQWCISVCAGVVLVILSRVVMERGPLAGFYRFWANDGCIVMDDVRQGWQQFTNWPPPEILADTARVYVILPLALLALPTFLMGWTYSYVQRTVQTDLGQVGWRVGLIQTANIAGSILGSLLTGAFLLGFLGTPGTLRLLLAAGALFGCLGALRLTREKRALALVAAVGVSMILAAGIPGRDLFWSRFHGALPHEVIVAEDASSMIGLHRMSPSHAVLRVNGTGHSVLPFGGPHTILGALPGLIHPSPENYLIIGLGAGNTAWAAGLTPTLQRIDVYEIARPEYEVVQRYEEQWFLTPGVEQLHSDPRVSLRFSDGRLALRLEDRKYDIIQIDALEPYMAYSGNLYSKEFFEQARDRLRPGGLFCTYAPTPRVRRTMIHAFEHVLSINTRDYPHLMIGSNRPIEFDRETILRKLESADVQSYLRESGQHLAATEEIGLFLGDAEAIAIAPADRPRYLDGEINTDLFPRDEFDKSLPVDEGEHEI